jgi:hypothetical protein
VITEDYRELECPSWRELNSIGRLPVSLLQRDRYRKKLDKAVSRASDEDFVQMVWAIDALQSERAAAAVKCLNLPAEAETSEISSKYAIHKWELETLLGELLVTPKAAVGDGKNRTMDCELLPVRLTLA